MPINFEIRALASCKRGGLTMRLIPGNGEAREHGIVIHEDAFGFIEPYIGKHWPRYANYGHWGISTIPAATWREIMQDMVALKQRLERATSSTEVSGIGFLFDVVRAEFFRQFDAMKRPLIDMICALLLWLESQLEHHDEITVMGI
jgi:hypothetical protein